LLLQLRDLARQWVFRQQWQIVRIQPRIRLEQLQPMGHSSHEIDGYVKHRRDFLIGLVRV